MMSKYKDCRIPAKGMKTKDELVIVDCPIYHNKHKAHLNKSSPTTHAHTTRLHYKTMLNFNSHLPFIPQHQGCPHDLRHDLR